MQRRCAIAGLLVAAAPAMGGDFQFTQRSDCGLTYTGIAQWRDAVAVGDYDGDGWLDVVMTGGPMGTRLYRNLGNKAFEDVTGLAFPPDVPEAMMAVFCDFDNDGDQDVLLARCVPNFMNTGVELLINEQGVFRLAGWPEDLGFANGNGGGMAVGDLDRDGWLDIARVHQFGPGFYLRQEAPNWAVDRTDELFGAGLSTSRRHWSVVLADFNNDGWPDLHSAIDFAPDYQARNQQDGTFADVSAESGVTYIGSDMGLAVGDIENDGDLDIYSTNIGWQVLYVNDGTGTFTNQAEARGVDFTGLIGWGWGTEFGDMDNDGDLDLLMVDSSAPGKLFINHGDGYFTRDDSDNGMLLYGFGLVLFDYDRDGDLDLIVSRRDTDPNLYENVSPALDGNHWLTLRLQGVASNRDGIGARLYAKVGGATLTREVVGGQSFVSGTDLQVHFGLGAATSVDRLEIRWPSGASQNYYNVAGDRELTIVEDTCQGDILRDGRVDLADLATFLVSFGACDEGLDPYDPRADLDGSGCVDLSDLYSLLDHFGDICD